MPSRKFGAQNLVRLTSAAEAALLPPYTARLKPCPYKTGRHAAELSRCEFLREASRTAPIATPAAPAMIKARRSGVGKAAHMRDAMPENTMAPLRTAAGSGRRGLKMASSSGAKRRPLRAASMTSSSPPRRLSSHLRHKRSNFLSMKSLAAYQTRRSSHSAIFPSASFQTQCPIACSLMPSSNSFC